MRFGAAGAGAFGERHTLAHRPPCFHLLRHASSMSQRRTVKHKRAREADTAVSGEAHL